MVESSGKRWKNEQFRWQLAVFLLVIPLIAPIAGCSAVRQNTHEQKDVYLLAQDYEDLRQRRVRQSPEPTL